MAITITETTDLRNRDKADSVSLGEASLSRGYLYLCTPGPDAVRDVEAECDTDEPLRFGYHGTDIQPCAADWLADDGDGYVVISGCDSAEDIERVEGWTLEPLPDLETGEMWADGCWRAVVVRAHGDHEYTIAGSL